jgi:hypothetical protein
MTKQTIHQILDELYLLDPSLKQHESILIGLIETIIASRPTFTIDETFVADLKRQLMNTPKTESFGEKLTNLFANMTYKKYAGLAGAGALLTALIVIPALTLSTLKQQEGISFGLIIEPTKNQAFGILSDSVSANNPSAENFGGGGLAEMKQAENTALSYDASRSMIILPPEFEIKYNYLYNGEIPKLSETVNVLKRVKDKTAARQAASVIKNLKFDLIDLSKFGDFNLQNLTLSQDKPFGHVINLNLEEGNISINENWQTWPQSQCQDEACFARERISFEQVPSDEVLINIAKNFIEQHNISLENYGEPEVLGDWKVAYETAPDKSSFYVPDGLTVLFPLKIQGMFVYESWGGNKEGLQVNISLKHQKVLSVYNLNSQHYQSSAYPAVTDVSKIKELISQGGFNNYQPENASKTGDVVLGEPQLAYVKIWKYENNTNQELLVPALVFPIAESPKDMPFYRKFIAIPLAEEMLKMEDGPIRIMPFDGGGTSASPATDQPAPLIQELK